ncbi:hypothetical protein [Streptomyces sp. NPDC047043]|uniref:hypothetical protein n=1 Tax=Streptomyces sp. NPDC047043 TaxID=3154497 RepID=UPI0033F6D943
MPAPQADEPGQPGTAELLELIAPALLPGETVRIRLYGAVVPHALAGALWGSRSRWGALARSRSRPVFLALTRHRLFLIDPGPPHSGWADPAGSVLVEAFRAGRGGTGRLRLRRVAAPERPILICVEARWRAQAARLAAELPSATPFTLPD